MQHAPVGSWSWATRTGGKLSTGDRRSLMQQALTVQVHRLVSQVTRALGGKPVQVAIERFRLPDSASALRAAELCTQLSPLWLEHHCTRTYLWGSLLAQRQGLKYDEELLFVAAMLHDLGLTETHLGKAADAHCFSVEGARAAKAFAGEEQWDERRQEALAEAICLHLNVTVDIKLGAEAHLLQAGAAYDVIGTSYQSIAPKTRSLVLERYPRLGFKHEINASLQQQVLLRPDSRAAFLYHSLDFGERIAHAPFAE